MWAVAAFLATEAFIHRRSIGVDPVIAHRRRHIHLPTQLGEKAADVVVAAMGSWRFIIIQSVVVAFWIGANVWLLTVSPFDPYPFILLNLAFSTQAAYASPLILMASNRQAQRDRLRDDTEAREVDELFKINQEIHAINKRQEVQLERQLEILELLKKVAPIGTRET